MLKLALDSEKLDNLDLCYVIPDMLKIASLGNVKDAGYEYGEREGNEPLLVIYLEAEDLAAAISTISHPVRDERILDNDLSMGAALYVEIQDVFELLPFE